MLERHPYMHQIIRRILKLCDRRSARKRDRRAGSILSLSACRLINRVTHFALLDRLAPFRGCIGSADLTQHFFHGFHKFAHAVRHDANLIISVVSDIHGKIACGHRRNHIRQSTDRTDRQMNHALNDN